MKHIILLVIILVFALCHRANKQGLMMKIISIPDDTPPDAKIYIAGNFNNWNPGDPDYQLQLVDSKYQIDLDISDLTAMEFKFTRGSWDTVEKGNNEEEIANHRWDNTDPESTLEFAIANWRDFCEESPAKPHTLTGRVIYHENFYIPQLDRYRTIRIYLPAGYDSTSTRYSVLYMHDGQNLFDNATSFAGEWKIDESLEKLTLQGKMEGLIVVGIDNHPTKRSNEYSPWDNKKYNCTGEGDEYVDFIVITLKPWVDENYRTLPDKVHTGIAGSSLGGLISFYAGCKYPETFSRLGIFSPAFWFAKKPMVNYFKNSPIPKNCQVYIDVGTAEGDNPQGQKAYLNDAKEFYQLLQNAGIPDSNLKLVIDQGAQHNEKAWARRFPDACLWLWTTP